MQHALAFLATLLQSLLMFVDDNTHTARMVDRRRVDGMGMLG